MKKLCILSTLILAFLFLNSGTSFPAVNHSDFIKRPFNSGQEVTKECLKCHEKAFVDVMKTTHWTWSLVQDIPGRGKVDRGKKNVINNFCITVSSNWPRCTSCHIGYGWKDAAFNFSDKTAVDCLVCHDTTGTYKKDPKGAGMPMGPTPAEGMNPAKPGVDLLKVAQNVGKPSRKNCGACHFFGGGGDKVKHGDLDTSLLKAKRDYDVHMGVDGANLNCHDCHKTENHSIKGNAMVVSPGGHNRIDCTDCHSSTPHEESLLNNHVSRLACQTCHIPTFAKALPTQTVWDWSTAGEEREVPKDRYGMATYDKMKGSFTWDKDIVPAYAWYNGKAGVYLLGDKIEPSNVTMMNWPEGGIDDMGAKIYPFKIHRGKQIYDKKNNYFIVPKLFGPGGYWKTYDWNNSAELGMKTVDLPYSGDYGFAETVMYWRINHMVVPAEKVLQCLDCHGDKGRLDWKALGYAADPIKSGQRAK